MTQRVIRTPLANEDVLAIWQYIARDNDTAANKLIRKFDEMFNALAGTPGMGSFLEQFGPMVRAFPVGKYIIFYREIDDGIEVIRVLHGARNLDDLL